MRGWSIVSAVLLTVTAATAAQVNVSMVDYSFSPDSVNINQNDEIVWTNDGYYVHTSTSGTNGVPDGTWNSGNVSPGAHYSRVFSTSGTFHYYCMHHYASGMTGVVVVRAAGVGAYRSVGVTRSTSACPNPFRSAVMLRSSAAGVGSGFDIYSASGRLVRSLHASGTSVRWDGRDDNGATMPAGVYHCLAGGASVTLTKTE